MKITEYPRRSGVWGKWQMFIFVTPFTFYNSTETQWGRLNLNKLLPPMRFPILRHLSFCFAGLSRQRKFVKGKGHQSLLLSLCNWAVWTYHKLGFRPVHLSIFSTRYELILLSSNIFMLFETVMYFNLSTRYEVTLLSRNIFYAF